MNIFFLVILFFLTGCISNDVKNIVNVKNIIPFESKIDKKIDDINKMNNEGYRCFYAKGKNKEKIKKEIYHQIVGEINTFVNSNTEIKQEVIANQGNKEININIDTSSFGFVDGVKINYMKDGNRFLAYTCLSEEEFNNLQKRNLKKIKTFFSLLNEYQNAINREDKSKISQIQFKINSEFPNIHNKFLDELNKKAKEIVKIDFYIQPKEVSVGDNVYIVLYSDKQVYAYFVLKTSLKSYFLKKSVIIPNKKNEIKLKINNVGDLIVYFTKDSLDINRYLLPANEISKDFQDYILKFKLSNYFKVKKLDVSIKPFINNKICIKSNKFLTLFNNEFSIDNDINCKNYKYLIKIKVKAVADGYVFKIHVNNNYIFSYKRFDKNNIKYLKEVVIPEITDKINSYLK